MGKKKVVICGGGIIGAATAYYLSLLDSNSYFDIIIVERESVACHSSGKAGGFLALDWNDHSPVKDLARLSYKLHLDLSKELSYDVGYRCLDTYSVSVKSTDSTQTNHQWIDETISRKSVIGTTSTTAQVDPFALTNALVKEAKGVILKKGTITDIETALDGAVTGVVLENDKLEADIVVVALGAWSSVCRSFFNNSKKVFDVSGSRAHSIIVESDAPPQALFTHIARERGRPKEPEIYPRPNGTVYICGEGDDAPLPDKPSEIQPNSEACETLLKLGCKVCPRLNASRVLKKQACYLPSTPDGVPIIGKLPRYEGVFVATGHSCWGILNGPGTGKCLAQLILGITPDVTLTPFAPGRLLSN